MRASILGLIVVACSREAIVRPEAGDSVEAHRSQGEDAAGARGILDAGGPNADAGAQDSFAGSGLLSPGFGPPPEPGGVRTEVKGCAANPETADQPSSRAAPGFSAARVSIEPVRGGVVVIHDLPHACCLKGAIATSTKKGVTTVYEELSGNPCRCMCQSTLRTAVSLGPGEHLIVLELERDGKVELVERTRVNVP